MLAISARETCGWSQLITAHNLVMSVSKETKINITEYLKISASVLLILQYDY